MAKKKKRQEQSFTELVPVQPAEIIVSPPQSGKVGQFLNDTENMFRARGMRMKGLFNRIDQTGRKMESLLRMAAEAMDAAEAKLEDDFRNQGLLSEEEGHDEAEENVE